MGGSGDKGREDVTEAVNVGKIVRIIGHLRGHMETDCSVNVL